MLQIAFIGILNQTNNIVEDRLRQKFEADINFINPKEAFNRNISLESNPADLIIYDLNTSHGFGSVPHNLKKIKTEVPIAPVIVMHAYSSTKFSQLLLEAGASGILPITPSEPELEEAVVQVLKGNTYIPSEE